MRRFRFLALIAGMLMSALFLSTPLFATNGMLLPAYGARQAGMGGAFTAVGGSVMDLESNPAHLAKLKQGIAEGGLGILMPYLTYRDSYYDPDNAGLAYQNKVDAEQSQFPLPYMGYASPLGSNLGWGLAFYAQGGLGAEFNGIKRNTPNGATMNQLIGGMTGNPSASVPVIGDMRHMTENTYSNFGFARLTPGLAIRLGDLSIGAGLDFGAALLEWRWTFSDPFGMMEMPGAGYRYESDPALSLSGKIGMVYDLTENFRFGYTYKARTKMYLDGDISINAGDPNYFMALPVSSYLEWPESHRAGIAYEKDGFTISLDLGYVKWSNVMNTFEFKIPAPWVTMPFGNQIGELPFSLKWEDQTIIAIGTEYKTEDVAYRAGYNYGKSPVGERGINPLFPAVTEHHVFGGLGFFFGEDLELNIALEYAFPSTVEGGDMSDWDMFHAISAGYPSINTVRTPYFNHSTSMYQIVPHLGIVYKF